MFSNIYIPLSSIYAQVRSQPFTELTGKDLDLNTDEINPNDELIELIAQLKVNPYKYKYPIFDSDLFLNGSDLINYLNYNSGNIITFTFPDLLDIYWNNRILVDDDLLTVIMPEPLPEFKNIYDYKNIDEEDLVPIYQLFGYLSKYQLLSISAKDFIKAIKERRDIIISIPNISTNLVLKYELADFWDLNTASLSSLI